MPHRKSALVDCNIIMYRHSLKRSKIEQVELYTKTTPRPHAHHHTAFPLASQSLPAPIEDAILFPVSFYDQQEQPKNEPLVFNPLNYEWVEYPEEVKRQMGCEEGRQSMGCYKGLVWSLLGNILHVWERKDRTVHRYKMHPETTCVEIGEIESSSLHFKTRKLFLLAAGVGNQFFLFGIDKQSFIMSDLKFNYELINSRCIQKIRFLRQNQIVVGSDTSNYCLFDFTAETRITSTRLPVLQRALPYLPLLYPSSRNFIEQLLAHQEHIYVLIREERPVGWFKQKTNAVINKLMMRRETLPDILQRKWIEVYAIDRTTNTIVLKNKITDDDFVQKLRSKHPQVCENKSNEVLKMASIYLSKESHLLSIVTKCGFFISLNQPEEGLLASSLVRAPRENSVGVVGLYLQKRELEEDGFSKQNTVEHSLGLDNLTLMNEALWFISETALEPLKCDRVEGGDILDIKSSLEDEWLVFTKDGFYRVARIKIHEAFVSYLLVRNELMLNSPEKAWSDEANFQLFVQNLAKLVGYERICESLIDCLLRGQTEFKIAQPVLQLISDDLRGHSSRNFRDWPYALSSATSAVALKISEKVAAQLWRRLLEMQSKNPKRESEKLMAQGISCNAYWYALRSLFVKYTTPLLQIEAGTIKTKMEQVQESIRLLQTLTKFFFLKGEKELRQLSEAVANRNNVLKKERSLPRSPISKLKPIIGEKKQQGLESTVDQTIIQHQNRFISESSIKLEHLINNVIKKLKTLVTIFLYLADLNETEHLGSIYQVLTSRRERAVVRRHLQARVEDSSRLEEFSLALPELELGTALEFQKWQTYQQKHKKPEMANLTEIAKFISSEQLDKLRSIFDGRLDSLSDLLLLYWDRLSAQLTALNRRQALVAKQKQTFASDRLTVEEETKEHLCSEMKAVEGEVQAIITKAIKAYINSSQEDYPRAEQMINDIIAIICSHDDQTIIGYAETEMASFGLAEKLILLKKLKKKVEVPLSTAELLARRGFQEVKPQLERECMSNFDIYMMEASK